MRQSLILSIIFLTIASACGPTKEHTGTQTARASTNIILDWTRTPTITSTTTPQPTQTPTPTATQTLTPTSTPTPASIGGGSGKLLFFHDHAIFAYDFTSHDLETVVSRETMSDALGLEEVYLSYGSISPDGQYFYLWICEVEGCPSARSHHFLASMDLSKLVKLDFKDSPKSIEWSSNGKRLLARILPGGPTSDGYRINLITTGEDDFGSVTELPMAFMALLSPDGEQVYFSDHTGFNEIDLNSFEELPLTCEACQLDSRMVYEGAISPGGEKVAIVIPTDFIMYEYQDETGNTFGYQDTINDIVVANRDFSSSQVLISDVFGNPQIKWSSDGKYILVNTEKRDQNTDVADHTYIPDFNVIDVDSGESLLFRLSEEATYTIPCGWSLDNQLFAFLAWLPISNGIFTRMFIQDINGDDPIAVTTFEIGRDWCPVWLPAEG